MEYSTRDALIGLSCSSLVVASGRTRKRSDDANAPSRRLLYAHAPLPAPPMWRRKKVRLKHAFFLISTAPIPTGSRPVWRRRGERGDKESLPLLRERSFATRRQGDARVGTEGGEKGSLCLNLCPVRYMGIGEEQRPTQRDRTVMMSTVCEAVPLRNGAPPLSRKEKKQNKG